MSHRVSQRLRGSAAAHATLAAALSVAMLWVPATVRAGFAPGATVHSETTAYTYNADGALTAQTTTIDQGSDQRTYFTWDNFLPTAADPSTGTVGAGNGNLIGYGPAPGSTDTAAFTFDRRNRLTGYAGTGRQVAYAYTAGGLLAAATPASGSGLRFYHDPAARMTNLRQDAGSAGELWSGDLGRVRTVGDGAEQVRLRPRKDVAGTYDAGSETVSAYRYDAYGAQSAPASAAYDIHANPVQYAGEYRDALWGGYYLRARWYVPELPLFLSRDPVAHLGRYGYGGGNPVMRVDPSGRSFTSFAHGRMGWQRWLQHLGGSSAWYSHVARLTAGMLLGPLQMVANPAGFAHAVLHDTDGMDIFLAAGVLSEVAAGYFGLRLTTVAATQTLGGAGQSALAAVDRSFKHFNAGTFVTGLEYTAGAELDTFIGRAVRLARASGRAVRVASDSLDDDESPASTPVRPRSENPSDVRPQYKNPADGSLSIEDSPPPWLQQSSRSSSEEVSPSSPAQSPTGNKQSTSDASGSDERQRLRWERLQAKTDATWRMVAQAKGYDRVPIDWSLLDVVEDAGSVPYGGNVSQEEDF